MKRKREAKWYIVLTVALLGLMIVSLFVSSFTIRLVNEEGELRRRAIDRLEEHLDIEWREDCEVGYKPREGFILTFKQMTLN